MQIKIYILSLVCIGCVMMLPAQTAIKKIPKSGKTVSAFIPNGFTILDSVRFDYDSNKVTDYAMVIAGDETRGSGDESFKAYTRILVILTGKLNAGFLQQSATYQLFESDDVPVEYSKLNIRRSTIELLFEMGTYPDATDATLYFRYQTGDWFLIGETYKTCKANNNCKVDDKNLVTGETEKYTLKNGKKQNVKKSKQLAMPLKKLNEITGSDIWK